MVQQIGCHNAKITVQNGLNCVSILRVQYLDYRCESVFRRDKLSESAMGVASNLSVIRGSFQRTFAVGSTQFVRCPESRSVRSWEVSYTLAL